MKTTTLCLECQQRKVDHRTQGRDSTMCGPCFEYAGWENTHSDDGHEDDSYLDQECPVCHPELDPRKIVTAKRRSQVGNQNARGKQTSHAMCSHPKTKAARERCRQDRRKHGSEPSSENRTESRPVKRKSRKQLCDHGEIWGSCAFKDCKHNWDYIHPVEESVKIPEGWSGSFKKPAPKLKTQPKCPTCGASGDEKCKSSTGKLLKNKGARHAARK